MEYRFTPHFSGRLGYAWMQNPYDAEFKDYSDAAIAGSNTIFRMEGDANYFTGGFGYRFNRNFFLDLALVYKTQTDELYPFPNWENRTGEFFTTTPFELKNTSLRGMVTLGYRF
jgi:long-subunit fatty acid transport protein